MASPRFVPFAFVFVLLLSRCSSQEDAPKVQLGLYYESLCPYSADFIVNSLAKIFDSGLISIVDLELFPYGNAKIGPSGVVKCQHGPNECLLNIVEACAINAWPAVIEHFKFIYCVEELVVEGEYLKWESCFQKLNLNPQPVLDCFHGGYGKQLELHYGALTDALKPPHKYVPWVVVNGRPLYEDYDKFETEVCAAYTGELPPACEGLVLAMPSIRKQKHEVKVSTVCYTDDKVVDSSSPASKTLKRW